MTEKQKLENETPPKKIQKDKDEEVKQIEKLFEQIRDESTWEKALEELLHKRDFLIDLAMCIWYSTWIVATLLHILKPGNYSFKHKSLFFYPFLHTLNKSKAYEYIRLTALGIIGALIKVDNSEVISYISNTEIIPLCLRIMENGI